MRRSEHGYPPYREIVQVALQGRDAGAVEKAAEALAQLLQSVPLSDSSASAIEVLGPAPMPVSRVRDQFRWQLLLLGERSSVREAARELLRSSKGAFRGVTLRVDVAPLQML